MRRFTLYILFSFLTFVIGSFIALNIYWKSNAESPKDSVTQNSTQISDERKSWEKPWTNPVSFVEEKKISIKPTCSNPEMSQIWNFVQNDKDFKEWNPISKESFDCEDLLESKEIDLNQDGKNEILLRGKNNLCSAVGNCAFWIYAKSGKGYKKLLFATDYCEMCDLGEQIKTTKTNGFSDVLVKGHLTASDTTYESYKFDGKKYKQSKCLVESPIPGTSDKPKWEFIGCKEFFKRWETEK